MNVATIDLCKELYELSGWNQTDWFYVAPPLNDSDYRVVGKHELRQLNEDVYEDNLIYNSTFAYDLGYLTRKLPVGVSLYKGVKGYTFNVGNSIQHSVEVYEVIRCKDLRSATSEDTAAKLAIELFKQGILTKEAGDVA